MIHFHESLTGVYSKRYVGKLTKWFCTTWKNGTITCFQNWNFLEYGFFTTSRRVFLNNFILKLFISIYVKGPSESDGYFEGYPLFTICCGCSDVISKNALYDCRYDDYTLPNQFLRTLTESYFRGVHNRFWWFQQGCLSG